MNFMNAFWAFFRHTYIRSLIEATSLVGTPECQVQFTIENAGFVVAGSVSQVEYEIEFDPNDLMHCHIKAEVMAASIRTGIALRDQHLRSKAYFDVENYPIISLTLLSVRRITNQKFEGLFDLTIKGITNPVSVTFTSRMKKQQRIFEGAFEFNRLDYHVGSKSSVLGEIVTVRVSVSEKSN